MNATFSKYIHSLLILLGLTLSGPVYPADNFIQSVSTLPDNRFMAISEDAMGYIWIGTLDGLARYDGYNYFLFNHVEGNPNSLKDNHVTALARVGEYLWVGTHRGLQYLGLGYKEFGNVVLPDSIDVHVTAIMPLIDGKVLVSTSDDGVFVVNPKEEQMENRLSLSVTMYENNRTCVNALCQDSEGNVWLGTEGGLRFYDRKRSAAVDFESSLIHESVIGLASDIETGTVYAATQKALYVIRPDMSVSVVRPTNEDHKLLKLFKDRHDNIYVSSSGNWLLKYNKGKNVLEHEQSLSNDVKITSMDVEAFYQDRNDNVWLGIAYSDIVMIKSDNTVLNTQSRDRFTNVTPGVVSGMEMTEDGNLWIGFMNRGLAMVDPEGYQHEISQRWYSNDMMIGKDGIIWSCSNDGRIGYVDKEKGSITTVVENIPYKIHKLAQDSQGRVYFLGMYQGLRRLNSDGQNEIEDVLVQSLDNGFAPHLLYALGIDSNDRIWVGGIEGLTCYDISSSQFVQVDDRLKDLRCLEIFCDSQDRIWIRTYENVVMFSPDENRIEVFEQPNYFEVFVMNFSEDGDGNIWTGSRMNLMRINPTENRIDMVIGIDVNEEYSHASAYDKNNNILYAGGSGNLRCFRIDDSDLFPALEKLDITGVYVRGQLVRSSSLSGRQIVTDRSMTVTENFRFSYDDNTITLHLTALNYGDQQKTIFEYQLDNQEWLSTFPGTNQVTFNKLEQGRHSVRIRAHMNNMVSPEKVIYFTIRAPWYGSVVADCIYVLLGLSVILLLCQYQYRKYRHIVSEKTLDAFTNAAHELCNPLSMVISPIEELMKSPNLNTEEKNQLIQIRKNSVRVQNAANQLIDIRRFEEKSVRLKYYETDLVSFLMGLVELYTGEAARRNILYSFNHPNSEIMAWIDRDAIDTIVSNLLSNAFKYTPDGGMIEVRIETGADKTKVDSYLNRYIEISVSDSGPGVDEKEINRMFDRYFTNRDKTVGEFSGHGIGLHLCKVLATKMSGQIRFENKLGESGAVASLIIPQGREHIKESDIVKDSSNNLSGRLDHMKYELQVPVVEDPKKGIGRDIKVMVIDDDESILNFLEENLKHNYRIICVKESANVIREIISHKPDILITDMVMPDVSGDEIVRTVKKNAMTSHIPVIILSGKNSLEDRMKGIESGADYYMTKPFYLGELKSVINTLMNNRLIVRGKFSGNLEQKGSVKHVEFRTSDEIFMKNVMDIINENMSNSDFSVEDVQKKVGLGRTQLFRKLKELTGFPPARFIQNVRMNQAYNLLKEKQMNISQIAYAVGFSSQHHFSSIFRQYYGVSPTEFINQIKEQQAINDSKDNE